MKNALGFKEPNYTKVEDNTNIKLTTKYGDISHFKKFFASIMKADISKPYVPEFRVDVIKLPVWLERTPEMSANMYERWVNSKEGDNSK